MRWPHKNPYYWHQKFAYLPKLIEGEWVWLEFYWARYWLDSGWWEYALPGPTPHTYWKVIDYSKPD